jgi:hypothetical protein
MYSTNQASMVLDFFAFIIFYGFSIFCDLMEMFTTSFSTKIFKI